MIKKMKQIRRKKLNGLTAGSRATNISNNVKAATRGDTHGHKFKYDTEGQVLFMVDQPREEEIKIIFGYQDENQQE